MRIPLFAIILVSASLLDLYHHTDALGIDSTSHGLLYGGRVVRRYGNYGNYGNLGINKRYPVRSRGLQERAEDPKDPPKGDAKDPPKGDAKDPPKGGAKDPQEAAKGAPKDKAKGVEKDKPKNNQPATPEISAKGPEEPTKEPAKEQTKDPVKEPSDTDTTTTPNQDQNAGTDAGTPTVPTGDMSKSAVIGLVSIGGVFALVAGLFAFSKRRKNKEMTKSIMTTSAKAWEHQNSTFEKMEGERETSPLGSYKVVATYTPTLADELDIQIGDMVTILVEFDDGWVQGINETRGGIKGVFPRHCVDMDYVAPTPINNKRSSSIGIIPEKYTEVDLS